MLNSHLDIRPEVKAALLEKEAVVALESTIISHGMPYPKNVETALQVEEIVRKNGAIPATIAILDGRLKVGLSEDHINYIAREGKAVIKTSRRDLPFIVAKRKNGATTVAATMIIAEMAGIRVLATGGIGGVHRGASATMDISADLEELAGTSVAVVCAGAKSILDIGLTLECLETRGVPVVGYKTSAFPAFYTRKSGFRLDFKVDSIKELASVIKTKWELGLKGGVLVANPIPIEYEMDPILINRAIGRAVTEATEKKISGKDITPYLLARIEELTGGASLEANIQLVYNNARVGAQLAEIGRAHV